MLYIGEAPKGKSPTHLTLLKHQNTKTAQYKLPKNHGVIALLEIFVCVRRKLLVTVFLDHPLRSLFHVVLSFECVPSPA